MFCIKHCKFFFNREFQYFRYVAYSFVTIIAFVSCIDKAEAQVSVNLVDYVLQSTGDGTLCTSNGSQCDTGYLLSTGEYVDYYNFNGNQDILITYTARTTGAGVNGGSYIGVIKDFTKNNYTNNVLRCFANPGEYCTAPPNTNYLPSGLPESLLLNVATAQDDVNASNSDGTPRVLIAGSKDITGPQSFEWVNLDPSTCAQTQVGLVGNQVFAVYVQGIPFGGDVGTRDAVVIEEVETAYINENRNSYPDHIERYYYVNGYGRVREATSGYDTGTQEFTNTLGNNAIRNTLIPRSFDAPAFCPQGTAQY